MWLGWSLFSVCSHHGIPGSPPGCSSRDFPSSLVISSTPRCALLVAWVPDSGWDFTDWYSSAIGGNQRCLEDNLWESEANR